MIDAACKEKVLFLHGAKLTSQFLTSPLLLKFKGNKTGARPAKTQRLSSSQTESFTLKSDSL